MHRFVYILSRAFNQLLRQIHRTFGVITVDYDEDRYYEWTTHRIGGTKSSPFIFSMDSDCLVVYDHLYRTGLWRLVIIARQMEGGYKSTIMWWGR